MSDDSTGKFTTTELAGQRTVMAGERTRWAPAHSAVPGPAETVSGRMTLPTLELAKFPDHTKEEAIQWVRYSA